jgi:hypothetical protein
MYGFANACGWPPEQCKLKRHSADPGFTAADLNNHRGRQSIAEGAAAAVPLALLTDDGPSGGFFSAAGRGAWEPLG